MSEIESPRPVCYVCHKPRLTCVCSLLTRVENETEVVILQHPRERLHPIGTARLAALGLTNVRLEVAWDAGTKEDSPPSWLSAGAALLYPAPHARDLASLAPGERPAQLVVIDGTWHTARTLYRDKTWLQRLPCYRLSLPEPSRYRIRREPDRAYVSSIEAIVAALRLLEPNTRNLPSLLEAFDRMIDAQIAFIARGGAAARVRKRRPSAHRRLPRALVEDFDRLVVVYAESAREDCRAPRALVQVAAVSLRTGATFERFLRAPFGAPSEKHLEHMQLSVEDFRAAVDTATFARDFDAFLGAADPASIVTAWNQSTLDLLGAALGRSLPRVALKGAYRSAHGRGTGSLDDIPIDPSSLGPLPFRGRAAARVARAVAAARALNALASEPASRDRFDVAAHGGG